MTDMTRLQTRPFRQRRCLALQAALVLLGLTAALQAQEQAPAKPRNLCLYAFVEKFTWEEKLDGRQILEEDGPVVGLGLALAYPLNPSLRLLGRGEFYLGEVDYDGGIQNEDGSITPYDSETTYTGARGALLLATPLYAQGPVTLSPLGGLGGAFWLRELDKGLSDSDTGPYGYDEYWGSMHGVVGARLDWQQHEDRTYHLHAEIRLPIWNEEQVDLSNVGGPDDTSLEPEEQVSYRIEIGARLNQLALMAYFETLEFDESEVNRYGFLQPESSATSAGAGVGIHF